MTTQFSDAVFSFIPTEVTAILNATSGGLISH